MWAVWLAYLPVVAGMARLFPSLGEEGLRYVGFAWLTLMLATAIYHGLFRCPRCTKFFTWNWILKNPWAQKCVHCKLPRGTEPSGGSN